MMFVRMIRPVLAGGLVLLLAACGQSGPERFQGWIEADLVFVGPDEAGRVETVSVREGEQVAPGAPLFALDTELYDADLAAANATLANARQTFERAGELLKAKAGTQKAYDDAQTALREAEARLVVAKTRLARRKVAAPAAGVVQQVYFRPGEVVATGRPIVAILPPDNLKVRFFVPERLLPKMAIGDRVQVECDGCAAGLMARVFFISRSAEYTPPVIYSLEERAKLVYLVEAQPERPEIFRVGQPVSVRAGAREKTP